MTSASSNTESEKETSLQKKVCLEYLLGLEKQHAEEETTSVESLKAEQAKSFHWKFSTSQHMRLAQMYLLEHRIFDFFQFITAHLLGASPENPIAFILELLNKCLLYRSHLGQPPLLFEIKHLDQLFNLMDRMKTGFIEFQQYGKGISSLGICSFNENPKTNEEGLVSKKVFVEEAYRVQCMYLHDILKVKKSQTEINLTRSDLEDGYNSSTSSYFMPSGLFKPIPKDSGKNSKGSEF